jgi:hypothetical protein
MLAVKTWIYHLTDFRFPLTNCGSLHYENLSAYRIAGLVQERKNLPPSHRELMRDEAPVFWRNFGNLFPAAACSHLQADLTDVLESSSHQQKFLL